MSAKARAVTGQSTRETILIPQRKMSLAKAHAATGQGTEKTVPIHEPGAKPNAA